MDHPLSDASATALFAVLRAMPQREMAQYQLDAFILHMRASSAVYDAVWRGTAVDPVPLLNERFAGFTPHRSLLPPFVTCFGPSVYVSGDGTVFGSWDSPEPPTLAEAEAMKALRNKHFQVCSRFPRATHATHRPNLRHRHWVCMLALPLHQRHCLSALRSPHV